MSQVRSAPPKTPSPQVRRTTPQQGRALEMLGHAIEYLVDSRMFDDAAGEETRDAVHTLMCLSRTVFAECEVVPPLLHRLQQGILRTLHIQNR